MGVCVGNFSHRILNASLYVLAGVSILLKLVRSKLTCTLESFQGGICGKGRISFCVSSRLVRSCSILIPKGGILFGDSVKSS